MKHRESTKDNSTSDLKALQRGKNARSTAESAAREVITTR
jgi:hypothetical protein